MRAAWVMLLVLAVAGCGSGGDDVVARSPEPGPPPPTAATSATSAPLPPAADGTNLDACKDGSCQVIVTAPAEFDVRGVTTSVTLNGRRVTIKQRSGGSTSSITVSGPNGSSTVGTGDGSVTVRLRGISGNQVALDISTST